MGASPLPASTSDADDDDEAPRRPRNRKLSLVLATTIAAGLTIGAFAFLGSMNSDRFVLACEPERAVPHQGRGFPPWGTRAMDGEAWKPLKIPAETRCQPYETDDVLDLERRFLAMVLDQVTPLLTAREVTKIDDADALLKQALLLTRPPARESDKLAAERSERHKDIERLLGDVAYWRATAKLRDAATALSDAAKQFETAAAQRPRHVTDAPAWATYARKLAQDLSAGPTGAPLAAPTTAGATAAGTAPAVPPPSGTADDVAPAPASSTSDHPIAPPGVELPVEPSSGSAASAPDAGVPNTTGGVLL